MKITPKDNWILVGDSKIEHKDIRKGALYIPADKLNDTIPAGRVIAVGPGETSETGLIPLATKVGEEIIYNPGGRIPVIHDADPCYLIRESQVVASVEKGK